MKKSKLISFAIIIAIVSAGCSHVPHSNQTCQDISCTAHDHTPTGCDLPLWFESEEALKKN